MTQLIVNQGSHDDRKAILSCILRLLQTCWNIGNFNAVAEIINGLKSVTRCVALYLWKLRDESNEITVTLTFQASFQ